MEPQNILRHKTWKDSVYNPPDLQFLVGWLYYILEQKVLDIYTSPWQFMDHYKVDCASGSNFSRYSMCLGHCKFCKILSRFVFPVPTAACLCLCMNCSLAPCAMSACCNWQRGNFSSGVYSLTPAISLASFHFFSSDVVCSVFLKEQSTLQEANT